MARECSDNVGGYLVWYQDDQGEVAALTRGGTLPEGTFVLAVPYDGPHRAPTVEELRSASPDGSITLKVDGGDLVAVGTGAPAPASRTYPALSHQELCSQLQSRNVPGGAARRAASCVDLVTRAVASHDWPQDVPAPSLVPAVGPDDGLVRLRLSRPEWFQEGLGDPRGLYAGVMAAGLDELEDLFDDYGYRRGFDDPAAPAAVAAEGVVVAYQALLADRLGLPVSVWDEPEVVEEFAAYRNPYKVAWGEEEAVDPRGEDVVLPDGGPVMLLTSRTTFYNDEGYETTPERARAAVAGAEAAARRLRAKELAFRLDGELVQERDNIEFAAVEFTLPPGTVLEGGCLYAVWAPRTVYSYWDDEPTHLEPHLVGAWPTLDAAVAAARDRGVPDAVASSPDGVATSGWTRHTTVGVVHRVEGDAGPDGAAPLYAAVSAVPVEVSAAPAAP